MTAEPARVISVTNPWAWRIVTGLQVVVERTWKPSWYRMLWIHTSQDSDLSAPAWQSRPVAGPDLLAYVHTCWLFALTGIDTAATCTQRKQHATSPLPDYRVWQAG